MSAPIFPVTDPLLKQAHDAWALQYHDAEGSFDAAQAVLAEVATGRAAAWAHVCIVHHRLRFDGAHEAEAAIAQAQPVVEAANDARALYVLSSARGRLYSIRNQFDHAIPHFRALASAPPPEAEVLDRCQVINGLAGCYWFTGKWSESLAYAFEALRLLRAHCEPAHWVFVLNNLGMQLVAVGDLEAAQRLLSEAISLAGPRVHPAQHQALRAALIQCVLERKDVAAALRLVGEIHAFGALSPDGASSAEIEHDIASAYIANDDWPAAKAALARALQLATAQQRSDVLACNRWLTATMDFKRGDAAAAVVGLEAAVDALSNLGAMALPNTLCRAYQTLSQALAATGQFERAFAAHRAFFEHHENLLGIASRAHYHALTIREELERTKDAAYRDALTGIHNRRFFDAQLLADNPADAPRCVAILDLDFFKRINDTHGHPTGDAVLIAFARLVTRGIRDSDVLARFGGEEFCLLLPRTECSEAVRLVERVLAMWCDEPLEIDRVRLPAQSFSAGVVQCGSETPAESLARADAALYRAKSAGRGRVERN